MPGPADPRKKPASVKIHVSTGAGVDIAWADGHASHFEFEFLREKCPCATCNDERLKKSESAPVALAPPSALPMYKPKIKARGAQAVGQYAIKIDFNDGHSTGIYSFDMLRTICPCADCARDFRAA
jgi:prepilin-type processing-associated H-X9-DG protein